MTRERASISEEEKKISWICRSFGGFLARIHRGGRQFQCTIELVYGIARQRRAQSKREKVSLRNNENTTNDYGIKRSTRETLKANNSSDFRTGFLFLKPSDNVARLLKGVWTLDCGLGGALFKSDVTGGGKGEGLSYLWTCENCRHGYGC
jgi:hypothetical protein